MKELKLKITMSDNAFENFKDVIKHSNIYLDLSKIVLFENEGSKLYEGSEVFFDCDIKEVKVKKSRYKNLELFK